MKQMNMHDDYIEELANYRKLLIEDEDYDALDLFDIITNFMYCPDEQLPF